MRLREYQNKASDCILEEWREVESTLLVLPTGGGKTVVFADVIRRTQPGRAMVLAHREELIWQARDKIKRVTGLECDIEMAENRATHDLFGRAPVVISTVQTQNSDAGMRKRMGAFKPEEFSVLIIDECFPAGTPVDGIPIEHIDVGNVVHTHAGFGRVTHKFKRECDSICRITFLSGETLACTPNHPIWTPDGFVAASKLTKGSVVATIMKYECECLSYLRSRSAGWAQDLLSAQMSVPAFPQYNPEISGEIWRGNHALQEEQRNEAAGSARLGIHQVEGNGVEANGVPREWTWSHYSRAGASVSPWVGLQCDRGDTFKTSWLSHALQAGCRMFSFEDWGGSGWKLSQISGAEDERLEKRGILALDWVENIEIFQRGSGEEFRKLCPEGVVYNLEVSNGNTYFANGILVHNCHHATAASYKNIINYYTQNPRLRVLGVTATPDRADEEALGQVFKTVAFDYEILDAIHDGWLVPVEQQMVSIAGLDFSAMRTTAGDLNGADLAAVMEAERNLLGVSAASLEIVKDRRAIVFTASVKQAEQLCDIFNRHKPGMSAWVCGATPKDERRQMLSQFAEGKVQVVCNCGVLTEGFDDAGVSVIVMARPTKSRSLYSQMVGRSTRPLPGIVDGDDMTPDLRKQAIAASSKPSCLVVDFVGNSGRHKLMTSADILGGKVSDKAIERAIERAKKLGQPVRMSELLDEEEEHLKIEEAKEKERLRRLTLVAKARYSVRNVSPFDVLDIMPVKARGWDQSKTLSEKQRALLLKQGIDPSTLPYTQARQLIGTIFNRWEHKLATYKQCVLLRKHGVLAEKLTMNDASAVIDRIAKNNWTCTNEIRAFAARQGMKGDN